MAEPTCWAALSPRELATIARAKRSAALGPLAVIISGSTITGTSRILAPPALHSASKPG